jgi:hypothetical protein
MPGRAGRPVQSMIVVLRITIGVILGSSATVDHVARTEIPISNHPFPHHGSAFHWREQANPLIEAHCWSQSGFRAVGRQSGHDSIEGTSGGHSPGTRKPKRLQLRPRRPTLSVKLLKT